MKKFKKAAALIIVIAWGILLLTTLITAFIDNETAHTLFKGLIFTDIVLPIVAYAMMLMYKYLSDETINYIYPIYLTQICRI